MKQRTGVRAGETFATDAAFKRLDALPPAVSVQRGAAGDFTLTSPTPVPPYPRSLLDDLDRAARRTPDRIAFAQRDSRGVWEHVSYAALCQQVAAIGQALIDRGFGQNNFVAILSGNSIEHAAMMLGAMAVGVPVAPISPGYSLLTSDFTKLRHVIDLLQPSLIFAQDGELFGPALRALAAHDSEVVAVRHPPLWLRNSSFADFIRTPPTPAVEAARARLDPDAVSKVLFTSGSTGMPKGVINTQRMMCANVSMFSAVWLDEAQSSECVTISWLPWNHTMAGNAMFNRSLRLGGSYYIDDGRPIAGAFDRTVDALRHVMPTHKYSDVPAGYAMLAPVLENDTRLRRAFFESVNRLEYAGASLPAELSERYQRMAVATIGHRISIVTGYGSTETAPGFLQLHWSDAEPGVIGLPIPGTEAKLVPLSDARYEIRARGVNVTPGYWRQPEATKAAFDEDGFFKLGDAVRFVDPNEPRRGLRFAGRVAEDFKLLTGTWVPASSVRTSVVGAAMPLLRDAVIAGHDREYVAVLAWLNFEGARALLGSEGTQLTDAEVIRHPALIDALRRVVSAHNARSPGSSTRVRKLLLMEEPPSLDANEITDKGYVNQSATLQRRANLVERLYAPTADPDVIAL
jgi:feruloyl-CoA synthase